MGCDIHPFVEVQMDDTQWVKVNAPELLSDRNYRRFGFLTGNSVRRVAGAPEVLPTPRGWPKDCSEYAQRKKKDMADDWGIHSASYLTLTELLAVDYDHEFRDLGPHSKNNTTLRDFLGTDWFDILKELKELAAPDAEHRLRILFNFDS